MNLVWTKHLSDKKAKEDFEQVFKNSRFLLGRLKQILEEMERDLATQETSLDDFDTPNWEYRQAFRNGEKRRLKKVKELLEGI